MANNLDEKIVHIETFMTNIALFKYNSKLNEISVYVNGENCIPLDKFSIPPNWSRYKIKKECILWFDNPNRYKS